MPRCIIAHAQRDRPFWSSNHSDGCIRMSQRHHQSCWCAGLLQDEIARNATKKSKSATDALMWLRRALRFLCALLMDIAAGNKNVANAATKAYGATLAKHHNFVVRGIFNLAMQSVPNYSTFIATLGPASEDIILQDMQAYSAALEAQLDVLDVFYTKHDIEV
eukprot:TRINITY_DN7296_c0_g1_i2.p2 TRINITY_DN7296_c0_g1~~TRINITY_DN7296_c0_g1_i2.p2  ORF type:complete len:163 (+),score=35.38 TRINITY_DN7296_c0_g1_i2:1114-1602(+)